METVIYPTEVKKYSGSIIMRNNKDNQVFTLLINSAGYYYCKTFGTQAEAFEELKRRNIENGLPIKNIIHEYEDRLEVELTRGRRMIADKEDLEFIQQNTITASATSRTGLYAITCIGNRRHYVHNFIMNHQPTELTIDHINRNGLDNRRQNLRIATKREQTLNRGVNSNNTSGVTGVAWDSYLKRWVARFTAADGRVLSKAFSEKKYGNDQAKQLAIQWRQAQEQQN